MNIMGTSRDVEASARGTMPFICSCIFFQFSRFSPAIASAKINFLSRSQTEVLLRVWIMKQAGVRFRQVAARAQDTCRARIMQTTLNRRCQSQRWCFGFQSMRKINKLNAEASHTTWIRNEKKHFLALFLFNWHLEFSWILDPKAPPKRFSNG